MALVGAGLAVVAVVLVSREERAAVDHTPAVRFTARVGWLTVGSGATFGGYFILLDQVPAGSGLWPLAMSRMAATAAVVVAAGVTRRRPAAGVPALLAVAAAMPDRKRCLTWCELTRGDDYRAARRYHERVVQPNMGVNGFDSGR